MRCAREVTGHAYAPYSHFAVGAAVQARSGNVYRGCNVENASYGLTICAERAAISMAVAAEGAALAIEAIAVVAESGGACSPCGACQQVIREFGEDVAILYFDGEREKREPISKLLPASFALPRA